MRDGTQQGAVTHDVDRRPASGRRWSARHRRSRPSSLLSAGGIAVAAAVGIGSMLAGLGADDTIDRSVDDDTTVYAGATTVASPFVPSDPSAAFGASLLAIDAGVVIVGDEGISGATATVALVPEAGPVTLGDVVFAERTVAAAGQSLVVVDTHRLRVVSIGDDGALTEIANHQRTDDASFGTVAAMGGSTVAVLRDVPDGQPAFVEVFDLTNGLTPVVALAPELDRVSIAVDASGDLIAVSGVRDQADAGEVQFFRRSGEVWLVDTRFDAIGGGRVTASATIPASFHVQRNGFFTRPTGTWTSITPNPDGILGPHREWSVQASSLAVSDGLAAFGLPGDERIMTFTVLDPTADTDGTALRHAQSIQAPIPEPTDDSPARSRPPASRFGTDVVFVNGRLIVSGPGAEIDGVADEGSIFVFDAASGPAGCTITGTDGDDILNGTTQDDVLCGLGGDDLIRGNLGFDRIYGGEGDDDLSGDADDDLVVGGAGRDRLAGGAGADRLVGGPGNDRLYGGAGDDHLDGGPDRDACYGGADIDTFDAC